MKLKTRPSLSLSLSIFFSLLLLLSYLSFGLSVGVSSVVYVVMICGVTSAFLFDRMPAIISLRDFWKSEIPIASISL